MTETGTHPRVGEDTETTPDFDPDELVYAEFTHGAASVMYHNPESSAFRGMPEYVVSVHFSAPDIEKSVYSHSEPVEEETAFAILEGYNGGNWGYVE